MSLTYKTKKQCLALILLGLSPGLLPWMATKAFSIYHYASKHNFIKADAAIVLGAAVWGDEPSPVFQERINHAISLYKRGDVRSIIFTGGIGDNKQLAEAIAGKRYAVAQGIREGDIFIETESKSTHENLKNALAVAISQQLSKFLIVSDRFHLKRAVLMARDLGMDAHPSPTPTTRYRSFKSQLEFLLRETYVYSIYLMFKI
jgi:uncharacterized SAM-binding protein YcdF (DUF218 family)